MVEKQSRIALAPAGLTARRKYRAIQSAYSGSSAIVGFASPALRPVRHSASMDALRSSRNSGVHAHEYSPAHSATGRTLSTTRVRRPVPDVSALLPSHFDVAEGAGHEHKIG